MSQSNSDGPRSARERLRDQRERDEASAKRLRWLKIGGAAIFVLSVGALVGVSIGVNGEDDGEKTVARPVDTGAADAPVTMTVWEDFRCPACGQFENTFRDTVNTLREEGKLRVEYRFATIIDGNLGGTGSKFAANAALCAEKEDKFVPYHDVLYENQPPEEKDRFSDKGYLVELAGKVPAADSVDFEKCVESNEEAGRVHKMAEAFLDTGYGTTPTVLLDGEQVYGGPDHRQLTPEELKKRVESKQ
jgi:protein-disulfide isomerase